MGAKAELLQRTALFPIVPPEATVASLVVWATSWPLNVPALAGAVGSSITTQTMKRQTESLLCVYA